MSRYEYAARYGAKMIVHPSAKKGEVFVSIREEAGELAVHIPDTDIPTVALELLKAAGRAELAGMIEAVEADRTARAEREAAEKKLQERRDAVARRFENFRHLVDAYLTLEDKLDGASRD